MLFWIICLIAAALVVASTLRPMFAGAPAAPEAPSDVTLYQRQLAEIDQDLARQVIAPDEAERARAEIGRRLLAANRTAERSLAQAPRGLTLAVALILGLGTLGAALGGYALLGAPGYPDVPRQARLAASETLRDTRPSQAEATADIPAFSPIGVDPDYLALVERLREAVAQNGNDPTGLGLLARHEAGIGNYGAALAAQEQLIALKGDAATDADRLMQLDLMIYAAQGYVSPEAEALARRLLAADHSSLGARYYLGQLYDQTDRPDLALALWRPVVENAPQDDPYGQMARRFITNAAHRAGEDYELPAAPGPSAADVANAAEMSPEDRQAMIQSMVDGLSERLATQGGTAAEWARLIGALGVLGERERATAIWREAQGVFEGRAEDLARINTAAQAAGLQ